MGPEDHEELSQKIFESAKKSTDEDSLEKELLVVIDEFTEKFSELGRAKALHEATSFLFNNKPPSDLVIFSSIFCIIKLLPTAFIYTYIINYTIS